MDDQHPETSANAAFCAPDTEYLDSVSQIKEPQVPDSRREEGTLLWLEVPSAIYMSTIVNTSPIRYVDMRYRLSIFYLRKIEAKEPILDDEPHGVR